MDFEDLNVFRRFFGLSIDVEPQWVTRFELRSFHKLRLTAFVKIIFILI